MLGRAKVVAALPVVVAVLLAGAPSAGASGEPPVTVDDEVTVVDDGPVIIDVLANDHDPEGDPLTLSEATGTADFGGTFECAASSCVYTPPAVREGLPGDIFYYVVSDGTSNATGWVYIAFPDVYPHAEDDFPWVYDGSTVDIDVLANDHHGAGLPLTVVAASGSTGAGGSYSCDTTRCSYTPPPTFTFDAFPYTITDGTHTSSAQVVVGNGAPIATDDSGEFDEASGVATVGVLANDRSPAGNRLSIVAGSGTTEQGGTVDCWSSPPTYPTETGFCTYTAPRPLPDTDSFDYTISDGLHTASATVTMRKMVAPRCADPTGALGDAGIVTGYRWIACTGPSSNGPVEDLTPLFPGRGESSFLMTTGTVDTARPPDDETGATGSAAAPNSIRGMDDVQILRVDLDVPEGDNCLAFDLVFGTEEYRESSGSSMADDGFVAELDSSTWRRDPFDGFVAPADFARGAGDAVSARSSYFDPGSVVTETGMQYDGSTPLLRVRTPITPGAHSLYLSVYDENGPQGDSGALLDDLDSFAAADGGCDPGASPAPPEPLVVAQVASVDEGDAGASTVSVPVVLQDRFGNPRPSDVPVTVDWRTGDYNAHAPGDYAAASGTLTFAPGETVKYVDIDVAGDTLAEPVEVGLIGLSNPVNADLGGFGPGLGLFGIRDDDPRPAASMADVSARALRSRPRIMRFTVTLDRPVQDYASVDVATVDGTAAAGTDYLPVAKTVLFTPMTTTRSVWVWVLPGSAGKDFTLQLSNPVGVSIGDPVAAGTIT